MIRRIPLKLVPAIGLVVLWVIALVCNMFGGVIDTFGAYCAQLALQLSYVIVPLTILLAFIPSGKAKSTVDRQPKKIRPIVIKILISMVLAFITILIWESQIYRSYYITHDTYNMDRFDPDFFLQHSSAEELDAVPMGEFLITEKIRETLPYLRLPGSNDSWGNPYVLLIENRDGQLWFGIYSNGRDGISSSKGNDPDDINSWDEDSADFYWSEIQREGLIRFATQCSIAFLFYFAICLFLDQARESKKTSSRDVR